MDRDSVCPETRSGTEGREQKCRQREILRLHTQRDYDLVCVCTCVPPVLAIFCQRLIGFVVAFICSGGYRFGVQCGASRLVRTFYESTIWCSLPSTFCSFFTSFVRSCVRSLIHSFINPYPIYTATSIRRPVGSHLLVCLLSRSSSLPPPSFRRVYHPHVDKSL